MKKIKILSSVLSPLFVFIFHVGFAQTENPEQVKDVKTIGIFDGEKKSLGIVSRELVYKINDYYIDISDISSRLLDSLTGKKVQVIGELKIKIGKTIPARHSSNGKTYHPYKEPNKNFIANPIFTIIE